MPGYDPVALLLLKMALVPLRPWPALLGFEKPQSGGICQASNGKGPLEHMAGFLEPPSRIQKWSQKISSMLPLPSRDTRPRWWQLPGGEADGSLWQCCQQQPGSKHPSGPPHPRRLASSGIPVTPVTLAVRSKRHYETQQRVIFKRNKVEGI